MASHSRISFSFSDILKAIIWQINVYAFVIRSDPFSLFLTIIIYFFHLFLLIELDHGGKIWPVRNPILAAMIIVFPLLRPVAHTLLLLLLFPSESENRFIS